MMPNLPDCTICGGPVRVSFNAGGTVEVCVGCGNAQRPITPPIDVRDIRKLIATVVEVRPALCDDCTVKRCTACQVPGCGCPRLGHPRRSTGNAEVA